MRRLRRALPVLVPALILVLALLMRLSDPGGLLADARVTVFDYYQRFHPREYQPVPVRIVDIDDASIERLGLQWPWPRTYLAQLVAQIANAGAAVIAFDIVFAEPDRTSPASVLPLWSATADLGDSVQTLATLPDHDQVFAQTIEQAGNVVLGFILTPEANERAPLTRGTFAYGGDDPRIYLSPYPGAVVNLPVLEQAADGNGTFSFTPDADLVLRRVPLLMRYRDRLEPSLVTEALRVAQGAKTMVVKAAGASGEFGFGEHTGINTVRIGRFTVPTDAQGRILVHYTAPVPDRYLPAWQVFTGDFDRAALEGQIVLIGTSASGLRDIRPSPINPVMPGVEAHAQAIEQILLGQFLQRPDWSDGLEWLYVLTLGLALILLLRTAGALWSAVIGGATVIAAFALSWYAYIELQWLLDPVTPSLAAFAIYLSGSLLGYLRTEAERRQVRTAFGQYLSPALVEQLAADPDRLRLGGETREMTFLFCDVRGFTTISEQFKANPQGLTHLINRFLTPMTDVILGRGGTIDKYMGDCIMAFWNAPLDDPRHADHACASALAMFEALKQLNLALEQEAIAEQRPFHPLNIGIGLNTGECVVGNMGSQQRFDYSVLGDAVNLASRLEGQSKQYGVGIVLGETTRARAPDWAAIELDMIAVKGKQEAVRIYALLGDETLRNSADFRALEELHGAMLQAYRSRQWDRARQLIALCRNVDPTLGDLYRLYEERLAHYSLSPPAEDWDGVFVAATK